jgi:hypothetical protein
MNGGGRYTLARVNKESSTMNGGGGDGRSRTSGGMKRGRKHRLRKKNDVSCFNLLFVRMIC